MPMGYDVQRDHAKVRSKSSRNRISRNRQNIQGLQRMSNETVATDQNDFDEMGKVIRRNALIQKPLPEEDRKTTLLREVLEVFKQCDDSLFAISPFEVDLFYDDKDCDGHCLYEDIRNELGLE